MLVKIIADLDSEEFFIEITEDTRIFRSLKVRTIDEALEMYRYASLFLKRKNNREWFWNHDYLSPERFSPIDIH